QESTGDDDGVLRATARRVGGPAETRRDRRLLAPCERPDDRQPACGYGHRSSGSTHENRDDTGPWAPRTTQQPDHCVRLSTRQLLRDAMARDADYRNNAA